MPGNQDSDRISALEEEEENKRQESLGKNSQKQDQQSVDENDPTWNRIKGAGKMVAGYLSAVVYFGTVVGPALAIGGAAGSIIGFGIKKISQAFGWKKGEEFGAKMTKYSLRVLAAPLYSVGTFLDGGYNLLSGNESNPGLSGRLDKATSYLSGVDKLQGQGFGDKLRNIEEESLDRMQRDDLEQQQQKQTNSKPVTISSSTQETEEDKLKRKQASSYSAPAIREDDQPPSSPRSVTKGVVEDREDYKAIDLVSKMTKAKTFEDAKKVYSENTDNSRKFKMFGKPNSPNAKGEVSITWKPPGAGDNEDLYVTLTYDKDKNVIKQEAGSKANAIIPPVKNPDGSYSIYSYKDGSSMENRVNKPIDLSNTLRNASHTSGAAIYASQAGLPNKTKARANSGAII